MIPSEAQRHAAMFEAAYIKYREFIAALGRVPASREVVLAEASRTPLTLVEFLRRKMLKLEP